MKELLTTRYRTKKGISITDVWKELLTIAIIDNNFKIKFAFLSCIFLTPTKIYTLSKSCVIQRRKFGQIRHIILWSMVYVTTKNVDNFIFTTVLHFCKYKLSTEVAAKLASTMRPYLPLLRFECDKAAMPLITKKSTNYLVLVMLLCSILVILN